MRHLYLILLTVGLALVLVLHAAPAEGTEAICTVRAEATSLVFEPATHYERVTLTVRGPLGTVTETTHRGASAFSWNAFDADGQPVLDGSYTFQLLATPVLDRETRSQLHEARARDDAAPTIRELQRRGYLPVKPRAQSGYFRVLDGAVIHHSLAIEQPAALRSPEVPADPRKQLEINPENDEVIYQDLIVVGSACIGFDCENGEDFDYDTLRFRENNLRVKFDDTSTTSGYPNNDWQLTANDRTSGGADRFSVDDVSSGDTPFTVEGDAPNHALYVDDAGNVGFGTSTPVARLHASYGNTPALRLQQTSSWGYDPQVWEVAGNEVNFFVRDVTSGSRLVLRIEPGAPTNSLYIEDTGDLGIGTNSPSEDLHIRRSGVPIGVKLENSSDGRDWSFKLSGSGFAINEESEASTLLLRDSGEMRVGNNGSEMMVLQTDGDLIIDGILTQNSDVHAKRDFRPVDADSVLERLAGLEVTTWSFATDAPGIRHMGPTAQDFHAAFGLGEFDNKLAPVDVDGVTLAAIQALFQQLEQKDAELQQLRAETLPRLRALEVALTALQEK